MNDKSERGQVASLTDDGTPAETDAVSTAHPDEYEAEAIKYLERGLYKNGIVKRLKESGLSEQAAERLADRVWREYSDERRTNSFILIGVAVILIVLSIGLLIPRVLNGEPLPTVSVLYLLIGLAVWFIVKAINDLRSMGTK
jgi:hypothetical protein